MVTGSLFGSILGVIIGHMFDTRRARDYAGSRYGAGRRSSIQQLFFDATFSIMGYIAKADGRVSEKEIAIAKNIMLQMQLDGTRRARAIEQFNRGKSSNFDYQPVLNELKRACWMQPGLLKTFLEIQIQIAYADGNLSAATRHAVLQVFQGLGIPESVFRRYEQQSRAGYQYQQHQQQSYQDPRQQQHDAYGILGVSASSSDAEVKKAYRRMMSKHHPDRLMSKGVPPEMIKVANQKTQQIKEAYDIIKKARGIT